MSYLYSLAAQNAVFTLPREKKLVRNLQEGIHMSSSKL